MFESGEGRHYLIMSFNDGKLFVVTFYEDVLQAVVLCEDSKQKETKFNISFVSKVKQYDNAAYKSLARVYWFKLGSQERIYNYNYVVFCK